MFRLGLAIRASLILGLLLTAATAFADRPTAPSLLPQDTLVMIRAASMPDLREKLKGTSMGRMMADPEIAPLADNLWQSLVDWFKEVEDRVGVPLDELRLIPQGEVCLAVIPHAEREPSLVLLLDVKDRAATAKRLIDKLEETGADNGWTSRIEVVGDVRMQIHTGPGGRDRLFNFEKEGTYVFASRQEAAKQILDEWTGDTKSKHLADNERFAAIMNRCKGSKDESPQLTWYIDPINLVRNLIRGNATAQTSFALVPVLGLDGLKGIGGSMILGTGEFDQVSHVHILLDNPRAGVLELLTLNNGDTTPEAWVPSDASAYMTVHWDLNQMYRHGAKLYNSLTEEGAFEKEVKERIQSAVELDFETDLLPAYGGRVTLFTWIEKPYRLNSSSNVVGVKLTDAKAFVPTLEKLVARGGDRMEKVAFSTVSYYRVKLPDQPENADGPPQGLLRRPSPCFGIVGDYLVAADGEEAFHHAISVQSNKEKQLANSLDYKLIAAKIKKQNGGETAGMISFNRPEEGLRMLYEVARGEAAKGQIERLAGEGNRPFEILKKGFDAHPLPAFSVIEKYFAPGGSMVTNEETGIHFMGFELKRE